MTETGKWIILAGLVLIAIGGIVWGLGKAGFRGLPGDIRYESPSVRVYFPIVSCIVLSVILTLLMWLIQWFRGR